MLFTCTTGPLCVNCEHRNFFISRDKLTVSHQPTMPPRRNLNLVDRGRALAWLRDGVRLREVGRRLGVSHSVISRLQQRFQATGRVADRPRPGRPRSTTQREDRFILRQALQARSTTANTIRGQLRVTTHTNISAQTVRNRLHDANLHARRPLVRPRLTPQHRAARLAWSAHHLRWNRQQWARVLFSDESRFSLEHNDGRVRVWRRPGERLVPGAVRERTAYRGGSVMVWGGISEHHRTPLYHVHGNMNAQVYRDQILAPLVVPTLQQIGPNAILQDDNATPHRARLVDTFLRQSNITRMDWPANSPDLNPIEHVWDMLDRRVRSNHPPPGNLQQLLGLLQLEWQAIPQRNLANLIHSMRGRCDECRTNRGGFTHY